MSVHFSALTAQAEQNAFRKIVELIDQTSKRKVKIDQKNEDLFREREIYTQPWEIKRNTLNLLKNRIAQSQDLEIPCLEVIISYMREREGKGSPILVEWFTIYRSNGIHTVLPEVKRQLRSLPIGEAERLEMEEEIDHIKLFRDTLIEQQRHVDRLSRLFFSSES